MLSDKKRKNKTESFCLARSWKSVGFLRRTNHSLAVVGNMKKKNQIPNIKYQSETRDFGFEIVPIFKIANKKQTGEHNSQLPHQLKFYNIIFFTEGQGRHYIDFKWYPVKEKTLVYLSKEQVHAFDFSSNLDGYCLVFTETFYELFF